MASLRPGRAGQWRRQLSCGGLALFALLSDLPARSQLLSLTVEAGVRMVLERHEDLRMARAQVELELSGPRDG